MSTPTYESEGYWRGFESGRINASRSEGDEYGGGWYTHDWRRGWDAGFGEWDETHPVIARRNCVEAPHAHMFTTRVRE